MEGREAQVKAGDKERGRRRGQMGREGGEGEGGGGVVRVEAWDQSRGPRSC